MPTPDEVYEQVLADETAKGSSPAVATARAKAARVRAERGAKDPAKASGETAPPPASNPTAKGGAAPAAEAPEKPAAAAKPAAQPAAKEAPKAAAAAAAGPAVPERVQRLLAVVKPEAIQKVERQPMDRVNVWPHLMAAEFVALIVVMAMLTFFSAAVDAPLRELANFNTTPNPSKAPWYFLGLQELLRYFHPQVAGVSIPTVIIIGLFAAPYIDRTPSTRPDDRKLAVVIFSFFMLTFAVLTILGMFFRGPGFNFVYPWDGGYLFFEL